MADVHIHHKKLGITVPVPEEAVELYKEQGWTRATKAQTEEAPLIPPPIPETEG